MWLDINHATCAIARSKGKPYLITPHGMMYEETLRRSWWKKRPLEALWYKRDIRDASCIHVTCREEMRHIRNYGYKGPVAVIGNPIEVPSYIDEINLRTESNPLPDNTYTIGFLGRLHPRKQVELILQGLSLHPDAKRIKVVIIGDGDAAYKEFLHKEVDRLGLAGQVEFKGFINGREKFELLSRLSALFVPSDMENFGMIIPEALLVNTPGHGFLRNAMGSFEHSWMRMVDRSIPGINLSSHRPNCRDVSRLFEINGKTRSTICA